MALQGHADAGAVGGHHHVARADWILVPVPGPDPPQPPRRACVLNTGDISYAAVARAVSLIDVH